MDRRLLAAALAGLAAGYFLPRLDLRSVLDHFYEQQGESKFLAVWRKSAAQVSYADCRKNPASCLGKTVDWPFWHLAKEESFIGDPSQPVTWSNEEQVPVNTPKMGPIRALSSVRAVHPLSIELVFLGSPQASYGGTTRKDKQK